MTKYEYKLTELLRDKTRGEVERYLNAEGDNGWALVALDYGCFIFRRELGDAPLWWGGPTNEK